ncbi:MAG: hypothetical protein AAFP84_01620 [Actinomycetota bacterium]
MIRLVNDGPAPADDVMFQLLDADGAEWVYLKIGQTAHRSVSQLAPASQLEIQTAQHKSGLWVRAAWSWTDGDGRHEADEIVQHNWTPRGT